MSKYIKVWSDDDPDYGALTFEQSSYKLQDIYNEMLEKDVEHLSKQIDDETIVFELYEFGEIDRDFEFFIMDFIDYDSLKGTSFYRVE